MEEAKTHAYAWSKSWIEFKAPNTEGVYWLRDKEGKTPFVGKRGAISESAMPYQARF